MIQTYSWNRDLYEKQNESPFELKQLYSRLQEFHVRAEYIKSRNAYPLLVSWENIKHKNIDSGLQRAYEEQYDNKTYEIYAQFDNSTKILFIDNLSSDKFSNIEIRDVIEKLKSRFGKIVITTSPRYDSLALIGMNQQDMSYARILPLGYKKEVNS